MGNVLFVCTVNANRSQKAAELFDGWRDQWAAKSAGLLGGRILTPSLVDWADLILVMEPFHAKWILNQFECERDKIRVLDIPDRFFGLDPLLSDELREKVPPILDEVGAEMAAAGC